MDIKSVWPKVVKLEHELLEKGETLSRGRIKRRFQLTENTARFVYEALKNRKIISSGANVVNEVAARDALKKRTAELKETRAEVKRLSRRVELFSDLSNQRINLPKSFFPAKSNKKAAIATALLSDTHFDEFVIPAEIGYVNGYSREIGDARLRKFFNSVIRLSRDYSYGVDIQGLVLAMGGDIISGNIHQELAATNEYPVSETLIHYTGEIATGIKMLAEEFKSVFIPSVPGNHGRFGEKVTFKHAVQDNWDYLLYNFVARELRNEKHIKFYIPVAPDAYYPVLNTRYCLTHGNQFRGGQGWMGALGPVMRGDTKKKTRQQSVKKPYDVMLCGHFHTQRYLGDAIMNGSMIGYNEYASCGNFSFEEPKQAYWLTSAEHGIDMFTSIHCKCDNEGWEKEVNNSLGFPIGG